MQLEYTPMDIERVSAHLESCTFCARGELVNGRIERPYNSLTRIRSSTGRSMVVHVCDECADEMLEWFRLQREATRA